MTTLQILVIGYICTVSALMLYIVGLAIVFKKKINNYKFIINNLENDIKKINSKNQLSLSFEDTMGIIDKTIETIWKDKYLLYYRLKEIKVIANMDDEVKTITSEIMHSFSSPFMNNSLKYFTLDYLTSMITRKVQMHLIEYTDTYKPNTK